MGTNRFLVPVPCCPGQHSYSSQSVCSFKQQIHQQPFWQDRKIDILGKFTLNCFQDLLDNSSVIKLCLLTRALNIFINSGREAADILLSADHFTITLCHLQRSWMKEEISIVGVGVLVTSELIFVLCRAASCCESCNAHVTDVTCVQYRLIHQALSACWLFNCRSGLHLDSSVLSLPMGCRFRYTQWLPGLVKWKPSIL